MRNEDDRQRLFGHYKKATLDAFKKFHLENPHVYERFKELAREMRQTGKTKYSSKLIINVMRWEHDLQTKSKPFKINDRFQSLYARLLIWQQPEYDGFFELRTREHSCTEVTEEDFI